MDFHNKTFESDPDHDILFLFVLQAIHVISL